MHFSFFLFIVEIFESGVGAALAPSKRPYHTIIPGMTTVDGELQLCYGVMGAFMQPQGHLQVISNIVDFGMDPQQALNALRFMISSDVVSLEEGVPPELVTELERRGHRTAIISSYYRGIPGGVGGAQMIQRDPATGVLRGASEPRKDGCAVGWEVPRFRSPISNLPERQQSNFLVE